MTRHQRGELTLRDFGAQDADVGPGHVTLATGQPAPSAPRIADLQGFVGRAPRDHDLHTAEHKRLTSIRQIITALKQARLQRSLTIEQVADAIGVHKSVISRFENESPDPHIATMLRYADAVGADFAVLVDGQRVSDAPAEHRPGRHRADPDQ